MWLRSAVSRWLRSNGFESVAPWRSNSRFRTPTSPHSGSTMLWVETAARAPPSAPYFRVALMVLAGVASLGDIAPVKRLHLSLTPALSSIDSLIAAHLSPSGFQPPPA